MLFKIKLTLTLWLNRITRGKSTAEVDAPYLANKIRQGLCKNGSSVRKRCLEVLLHCPSDPTVTVYSQRHQQSSGNASGHKLLEIENIHRLPEVVMHDEHLTADECDELAEALRQHAAALPNGWEKEIILLKLAEGYRDLANIKRIVLRKVN
jgi:hypothetical protein